MTLILNGNDDQIIHINYFEYHRGQTQLRGHHD